MNTHQKIITVNDSIDLFANYMDQTDDNVAVLPIEQKNTTGTCLHHLNEDCLLEIFSSKSLNFMDLSALADTCKRFKPIAQRVFPKTFGSKFGVKLYYDNVFKLKSERHSQYCRMPDVDRILKNFGSHLSTLTVRGNQNPAQDVVNAVAKYCGTVSLKRLKICGMDSVDGLRVELKSVFQRLLKLSIYNCNFVDASSTSAVNCGSLIEFEIRKSSGCGAILTSTFPNLKLFTFADSQIFDIWSHKYDNNDALVKFIERHKGLRAIEMGGLYIYCSSKLIQTVGDKCEHLEELRLLKFNNESEKMSVFSFQLRGLTNLRKLDISEFSNSYLCIALLQASKSLETVIFDKAQNATAYTFTVLSQLPNLRELYLICQNSRPIHMPFQWTMFSQVRKLHLDYIMSHDDILNIIKHLVNLDELELPEKWVNLSQKYFSKIVKIVERRPNVLTLKCKFDKFPVNCCESQKVKLIKISSNE